MERSVGLPCKFGLTCTRPDCTFDHPDGWESLETSFLLRRSTEGALDFWGRAQEDPGETLEIEDEDLEGNSSWLCTENIQDPNFQLACDRPLRNSIAERVEGGNTPGKPHWAWEARVGTGKGMGYPTVLEYARLKGF